MGPPLQQSEISLKEVKECNAPEEAPKNSSVTIQVVQQNDDIPIKVISCKVEVLRLVQRCSMFSDLQSVKDSIATFYPELSMSECKTMIETRSFSKYGVTDLTINGFSERSVLLKGTVKQDGKCEGEEYTDWFGSYSDVVVHATIKFTLYDSEATFNAHLNEIYLKTGVKCVFTAGTCFDPVRGNSFWDSQIQDKCDDKHFSVLYEGPAVKFNDSESLDPISYLVDEEDIAFSLKAIKKTRICHQDAYQTEYARFYVLPKTEYGFTFAKSSRKMTAELLTYFNIKFVFLEKHISTSLRQLYSSLKIANCQLERQLLEHHLTLALHHQNDFAFLRGGGPGFTAVTMGEVSYLLQCRPTPVELRQTSICYNEIPVFYNNNSMFLAPRTRILTKKGTEIDCTPQLPVKHEINGVWYAFSPHISVAQPPSELQSRFSGNWKYESPKNLLKAGIYTQEDLQAYQRRISYPLESAAVQTALIREALGYHQEDKNLKFENFLTEVSLNKIIEKTTHKVWGVFHELGTITSGMIGIIFVFKMVKTLLDMVFFGKLLHEIFGWSWKIIAAICDSFANYLIHNHHVEQTDQPSGDFAEKGNTAYAPTNVQSALLPSCPPVYMST